MLNEPVLKLNKIPQPPSENILLKSLVLGNWLLEQIGQIKGGNISNFLQAAPQGFSKAAEKPINSIQKRADIKKKTLCATSDDL